MGIVLAAQSTFTTLRQLYQQIDPIFERFGFTSPSPAVIARELSRKIEACIVQHCASFSKGPDHWNLQRGGRRWEVRLCKDAGLTIGQSDVIDGENYVVVHYKANSQVVGVWVLWEASDQYFSPKRSTSNTRSLLTAVAASRIERLYDHAPSRHAAPQIKSAMAKSSLKAGRQKRLG